MAAQLFLSNCVVENDVYLDKRTNMGDKYATLTVKEGKTNEIVLNAFDDSRMNSPYKRLKQLKIRKGSHLNIIAEVTTDDKVLIPYSVWKKVIGFIPLKEKEKMFPGGANPSATNHHYFRIINLEIVSGTTVEEDTKACEGKS